MTTISVVIPAYNDALLLERCLAALAAQHRPADEIIVVDNASTDTTASVAQNGGARVVGEPARGIWPAAATGYDAATGDLLARLDADSVPPVDWLLRIESKFALTPDVDVVSGPGDFYDGNRVAAVLGGTLYIRGYFWLMRLWLTQWPVFGSNFAMRRSVWLGVRADVHRTRSDVHDDLDLSFHLAPDVTVAYEPTLRVGISGRPLGSWSAFGRRLRLARRTMRLHWPADSPWRLRMARHAAFATADAATRRVTKWRGADRAGRTTR